MEINHGSMYIIDSEIKGMEVCHIIKLKLYPLLYMLISDKTVVKFQGVSGKD